MTKCWKILGYGATSANTPGTHLVSNGVQYPSWIRATTVTVNTITVASGYYAGCLAASWVADGVQSDGYAATIEVSEDPDNPNCPVDPNPPPDARGCPGTWVLHDNWSGHPTYSGNDTYAGYEYDNPTWTLNAGSTTQWSLLCAGTDNRSLATASINDPSSTLYSDSKTFTKNDPNCKSTPPQVKHDCINKGCIPASVYKTPGFYASLADCQADCGSSGCNGHCVSTSDWAQIEGLSNQLKNRNCG